MRIIITGIAGFVGRHLLNHIIDLNSRNCTGTENNPASSRLEILGADIYTKGFNTEDFLKGAKFKCAGGYYKIDVLEIDLRNKKDVKSLINSFMPDAIYHLAAQSSVSDSWKNPVETFEMNVFGGINIFESAVKYCPSCKILVTCTAEEYDVKKNPSLKPVTEDFPIKPKNPYAISKAALDFFSLTFQQINNLYIYVSRSFNHTGPGQSERFVTSDFAKQVALIEKGLQKPVVYTGNLDVYRDFLDVRDVVRAYTSIVEKGKQGHVYNVCSGRRIKISKILEILISLSNVKNIKIEVDKNKIRPIDSASIFGDNSKLKEHTGWQPRYDISESLSDTLNWWRERRQ